MKLIRIIIILIVVLGISAAAGFIALNYVADRIIDEGIAGMLDQSAIDPKEAGNGSSSEAKEQDSAIENNQNDSSTNTTETSESAAGGNTGTEDSGENQTQAAVDDSKVDGKVKVSKDEAVSKDTLQTVSRQVPMQEKAEITKIVMSKLSGAEISELTAMASGGITAEEKKKAKEIVYSKFTPTEIEYLMSLYNKYMK